MASVFDVELSLSHHHLGGPNLLGCSWRNGHHGAQTKTEQMGKTDRRKFPRDDYSEPAAGTEAWINSSLFSEGQLPGALCSILLPKDPNKFCHVACQLF